MGQLLKVTSVPMQTIRFTQNARLVPADHVDIERRKAMARHFAFSSRYSGGGHAVDLNYVNQVNRAFAGTRTHSRPTGSAVWSAGAPPFWREEHRKTPSGCIEGRRLDLIRLGRCFLYTGYP